MIQAGSEGQAARPGNDKRRMIFFGHARLPQPLSGLNPAGIVTVELEVDEDDGTVVDVVVGGFPTKAGDVVCRLLSHRNLNEEFAATMEELPRRYVGLPQKALCTALQNAYDAYKRHVRPPNQDGDRNGGRTT